MIFWSLLKSKNCAFNTSIIYNVIFVMHKIQNMITFMGITILHLYLSQLVHDKNILKKYKV